MISIVYILSPRGAGLYTSAYACMLQGESKAKIGIFCISPLCQPLGAMATFEGTVHCVIKFCRKYDYTIPTFSVITVCLRHAVMQIEDEHGQVDIIDVFFRDDPSLEVLTPTSVKITKHSFIDVSII